MTVDEAVVNVRYENIKCCERKKRAANTMCPEVVEGQRYEQLGRYNWYLVCAGVTQSRASYFRHGCKWRVPNRKSW